MNENRFNIFFFICAYIALVLLKRNNITIPQEYRICKDLFGDSSNDISSGLLTLKDSFNEFDYYGLMFIAEKYSYNPERMTNGLLQMCSSQFEDATKLELRILGYPRLSQVLTSKDIELISRVLTREAKTHIRDIMDTFVIINHSDRKSVIARMQREVLCASEKIAISMDKQMNITINGRTLSFFNHFKQNAEHVDCQELVAKESHSTRTKPKM